ncbi:MAG: hypothetical protein IH616_19805, partial [Gemmatimonadales bacterium]|nr:hypothetical protein [Gemmatimonadales bacterium]
ATFVLGVAVGGVGLTLWGDRAERQRRPPQRERPSYAEMLQQELALTAVQRDSVEAILARREQAMQALWQGIGPQFDSLRTQIRVDIGRILDADQNTKYQDMVNRSEQRRSERDRGTQHGR